MHSKAKVYLTEDLLGSVSNTLFTMLLGFLNDKVTSICYKSNQQNHIPTGLLFPFSNLCAYASYKQNSRGYLRRIKYSSHRSNLLTITRKRANSPKKDQYIAHRNAERSY